MIDGKNLMIVAHPDDEVLFGFSELLYGNWHVLCMTNFGNDVRYTEFCKVMEHLGTSYTILSHKDEWEGSYDVEAASSDICSLLGKFDPVNVLTHNECGEYGHSQHWTLHFLVKELVKKNLYVFDNNARLSFKILSEKMETLSMYKSQIELNAFDWYEHGNESNDMMNYVINEGVKKIC